MLNDMASDIKGVLETYEEQLKQANQHKSLAEKECLVYKKQLQVPVCKCTCCMKCMWTKISLYTYT